MTENEYLLTCLAEECSEIAQRISKGLRFGMTEVQPDQPLDNQARIELEMTDYEAVRQLCIENGVLTNDHSQQWRVEAKRKKIGHYMAYSRERGVLQ